MEREKLESLLDFLGEIREDLDRVFSALDKKYEMLLERYKETENRFEREALCTVACDVWKEAVIAKNCYLKMVKYEFDLSVEFSRVMKGASESELTELVMDAVAVLVSVGAEIVGLAPEITIKIYNKIRLIDEDLYNSACTEERLIKAMMQLHKGKEIVKSIIYPNRRISER